MNLIKTLTIALSVFACPGNVLAQAEKVESIYLGEVPPGEKPKLFPLSAGEGHFVAERIAFSGDGGIIYYSEIQAYYPVRGERIKMYVRTGDTWSGPFPLFEGYIAPALSVTGDTMYMQKDTKTYMSVNRKEGWTAPVRILKALNYSHYYQVTGTGSQYVSSLPVNGEGRFDWCRIFSSPDTVAISLGKPLNNEDDNLDFCVSRDDSFIILTGRAGLTLSFREVGGTWGEPLNPGPEINFGLGMWGPCLSSDQKYLFYSTGTKPDYSDTGVFWVRIDAIVDSLRKIHSKNVSLKIRNQ